MKTQIVRRLRVILAISASLASAVPSLAEPLLQGSAFNKDNLIAKLKPSAPSSTTPQTGDEDDTRSLGIAPSRPRVNPRPASPTPPKASASVLITFDTNSFGVADQARPALDIIASALKSEQLANLSFAIEGHADPRGNPKDNLLLSQMRAESIVQYLVERHSIGRDRLKPVGKGDTEPANRKRVDAPENRRVTIVTCSSGHDQLAGAVCAN